MHMLNLNLLSIKKHEFNTVVFEFVFLKKKNLNEILSIKSKFEFELLDVIFI